MTIRSSQDSFTENIETNIGLIKRRIKSNSLWNTDLFLGKYKINSKAVYGMSNRNF